MRAALTKIFADGGQASVSHSVLYQGFNRGSGGGLGRLFNSSYSNNPSAGQNGGTPGLEFDYRRPLWAGGGTEFSAVAGPISRRPTLQNVPQVNQGVVISRIRTDLALAEFEQSVIGLAKDVEDVYWELYLAYRRYDTELVARNSSLSTWRQVKAKADEGLEGGDAASEAQARDSYFEIRARSEDALANLYNSEGRLRRLMGLAVNDGRIIRPSDEPTTAEFLPDWRTSLCEALTHRVELQAKVEHQEFGVPIASGQESARNRGLISCRGIRSMVSATSCSAIATTQGQQSRAATTRTCWLASTPAGAWASSSACPSAFEPRTLRSVTSNCGCRKPAPGWEFKSMKSVTNWPMLSVSWTPRSKLLRQPSTVVAAERRVQAHDTQYKAGKGSVDLLLRSQISLAQAEVAYYQSLVGYNRAIVEMKYRKGTLLDNDNVRLSESLSHPESYAQALRYAWRRSHAFDAQHLDTKPGEFWTDPAETGVATYSASGISEPLPPESVPASELPDTNSAPTTKEAPNPTERDSIPLPPQETPDAKGAKLIPVDEKLLPVASKRDLPKVPQPSERQVASSLESLREAWLRKNEIRPPTPPTVTTF